MPNSDRLTIAVFGNDDTVTREISSSWFEVAVELIGPYSARDMTTHDWRVASALIDVRYLPEDMLPLMDELEAKAIPYIFIVPIHAVKSEPGPFVLSAAPRDIRRILAALSEQNCGTKH